MHTPSARGACESLINNTDIKWLLKNRQKVKKIDRFSIQQNPIKVFKNKPQRNKCVVFNKTEKTQTNHSRNHNNIRINKKKPFSQKSKCLIDIAHYIDVIPNDQMT